jgi:hypothetical protein
MTIRTRTAGLPAAVLAFVLGLTTVVCAADEDRLGGRIRSYDPATGTLVVGGRQIHLGPSAKLVNQKGERISSAALGPGVSVGCTLRRTSGGVPELESLVVYNN